ncbi:xanthine dehydrogenase family protein molybdopterin-binding subunit [Candidatus Uabimicrobium sp. HlEnr_7]|uniref:xanthine dehydrogenase family protein molybdopterin-binding subunit n=1 Tax=Candidatus Uabimicrobium helgolandensis TaxID=3095367 RepID=UPI00355648E1
MAKDVELHVGVGKDLSTMTTKIPDNAPRPWDGKYQTKHIGKRVTRIDGKAKATGKAKYTFDIQLPGMLHGQFVRCPYPSAIVESVDTVAAEAYPGVKAVMLVSKLPMTIRHADQEVVAIAATSPHIANEAAKLIKIKYTKKPFVLGIENAMSDTAPLVFKSQGPKKGAGDDLHGGAVKKSNSQKGNIRGPRITPTDASIEKVDEKLQNCASVVEATYQTQVQTHSALETHGVVAKWEDDDHLTVWASTQSTFVTRNDFATRLELPQANVRVITEHMGGGFGAKFRAGVFGIMAAKLAKKTQSPVKLMHNRREEHASGGNRPDTLQKLAIGCDKDGTLSAIKLHSYGSCGMATGGASKLAWPAKNIYQCDDVYLEESDVFTHSSPGTAFRAPGHPQGAFALEQTIDELAYKVNIDPLEFRKKNSLHHKVRQAEYEVGAKKFGWDKRNPKVAADKGVIKRGVGMANSVWYYFYMTGFQATIEVHNDGSVELMNGVQDLGTGIRTILAMVVAEELGLEIADIKIRIGDSTLGYGPASGGSQTTGGITPAARDAAYLAKMKMKEVAATAFSVEAKDIECDSAKFFVKGKPENVMTWKQVAARIPGDKFMVIGERKKDHHTIDPATVAGMQFAEVEVDTETGVVKVNRVVAVHDCGRPMNRLTLESQINGGVIQGISYALFEDRILDRNYGMMVNPNLEQYKIAGSMDVPEIDIEIMDVHHGCSSTGAIGIGEPATVPTAAAIANAVYHAIGVRIRELPITPDKVLKALASKGDK